MTKIEDVRPSFVLLLLCVHGGLTLLNLKDHTRLVQDTTLLDKFDDAHEITNDLRLEYVITLDGVVRLHSSELVNEKMKTGQIEVAQLCYLRWSYWKKKKDGETVKEAHEHLKDKRLKEIFQRFPSLEELSQLEAEGYMVDDIVVDVRKDKKLLGMKRLIAALVKGLNSIPPTMIEKIAGLFL